VDTGALAIEAVNLTKTYPGDVQAVKGISFEVAPGKAVTLLASLGAGVGNRLVIAAQVKRQRRADLEDRAGFR